MEIIRGHFTRQLREVQEDLVNMTQAAKRCYKCRLNRFKKEM